MANLDANFESEVFRHDHVAIVAANRNQCLFLGARLHYDADGYAAGTVLAQNTVNNEFYAYDDAGSSGLNTAKCILTKPVLASDFPSASGTVLTEALFKGTVFYSRLTGIDANGVTDLAGRRIVDVTGVELLVF